MEMVNYSQSSQNSKIAMSLQISKKKLAEVDFLHTDKHQCFVQVNFNKHFGHQSFLQGDTIITDGYDQAF